MRIVFKNERDFKREEKKSKNFFYVLCNPRKFFFVLNSCSAKHFSSISSRDFSSTMSTREFGLFFSWLADKSFLEIQIFNLINYRVGLRYCAAPGKVLFIWNTSYRRWNEKRESENPDFHALGPAFYEKIPQSVLVG